MIGKTSGMISPKSWCGAVVMTFAVLLQVSRDAVAASAPQPNIVWIVSEDHGIEMGCYGDRFATTPNVDRLAARGMIYRFAWSCAPVCAPARSTLIAGLYAPSSGAEHMRSLVPFPAGKKIYPQLMRDAGYYCVNNAKEDYNLDKPGSVWNESSRKAHWTNRPAGMPFLAVFNSEKSHESKIRSRPHTPVHDPAGVRLPAYHPDTPEVRRDWAQYYDVVSEADADAGKRLAEIERAGLTEDTIVFYYGDHGSGMPRSKRWPYNSGLRVPLVVFIPEKFKHLRPADYRVGGVSDRLVSFVDFAPTLVSLAGVKPPGWMQGHAFLGKYISRPPAYLYGFRGRMDERLDLVRSITDGRFVYVRNYLPHLPYGQYLDYMWKTPTTVVWEKLHLEGKLSPVQDAFWNRKPPEELYDLQSDPDEIHNLASSAAHRKIRDRLHKALQKQALEIRDVGFIPEGERFARAHGDAPYDLGHDNRRYPMKRILAAAETSSMLEMSALPTLRKNLHDPDAVVRYWAVLGILMRGRDAVAEIGNELTSLLKDSSPDVRIAAAEAVARYGSKEEAAPALSLLLDQADWKRQGVFSAMSALNSIDALGQAAASIVPALSALPTNGPAPHARYNEYVPRLIEHLLAITSGHQADSQK